MARKEKRYHYIYKTTCKITNNFYVGMHSTDNLEDGYIGSGKRLWNSVRKHGLENHVAEILEFLPDRKTLKRREAEIVNEQFLQDPLCMNLQIGGGGGFSSEEHKMKCSISGGNSFSKRLKNDKEFFNNHSKISSEKLKKAHKEGKIPYGISFLGKQHSEESKQKIREKAAQRVGDKNSQFGSCWITNGLENKKIKKTEKIPDGWKLGRTINKKMQQ